MQMRILLLAALAASATSAQRPTGIKDSRFFKVDLDQKKILQAAERVGQAMKLDLLSVTTDQPQYWPNEKVFLKVLAPGAPKAKIRASLQKRDAAGRELQGELDAAGVLVLEAMDGEKKKLELGEYRIDLEVAGMKGSATFSVVEGTLGGLSFAHDFKKVTSVAELEAAKGAWFLGNAAGAGKRWGNGLSFKNELRLDNLPYTGEADIHSRCMLPGCNGTYAGRSLTHVHIEKGAISGTLDVGGHSGPFQIEVITDKGSLRHQFEGSSHVERDMIDVSGGMSFHFRAGLAPYEKTEQVPGRQLFLERTRSGDDAFEAESALAKGGRITIKARKKISGAVLAVYAPKADASFKLESKPLGTIDAQKTISVDVAMPYAVITLGGFVDGVFAEAWLVAFRPGELQVAIDAPASAAPKANVSVRVQASDASGKGVKVSGILEAFDIRVASKSALSGLGSALGDALRNTSQAVSSWQDNTGLPPPREAHDEAKEDAAPARMMAPMPVSPQASGAPSPKRSMARMMKAGGAPPPASGSGGQPPDEGEAPAEAIREGERKVVFCGRLETDASGTVTTQVTLPPQMGRVVFRFVAVSGLDHASAQRELDASKAAAADLRAPKVFVPGAKISLPLSVQNNTADQLSASVSGPGVAPWQKLIGRGDQRFDIAWTPNGAGVLAVTLSQGKTVLDRRELRVDSIGEQPVTSSRLEVVDAEPVQTAPDETATIYRNPGELMRGVTLNLFTTMESWFGHAEALSAKVAASAVVLAAIHERLLSDDGMEANLIAAVDKHVRDLESAFFDPASGLMRPYPGIAPDPLWSGWVAKNLHAAARALSRAKLGDVRVTQALAASKRLAERLDKTLVAKGLKLEERFAHDASGQDTIAVEIDGKVLYKVLSDDAVSKWAAARLGANKGELDVGKAYDTFRFLRAFERVGALQYMTDLARALYAKRDMATFVPLFRAITKGMILAQEPGMIAGPALLGGVYSTPMALVRFLELQLEMGKDVPKIARIDKKAVLRFAPGAESFVKASVSAVEIKPGGETTLRLELDPSRDPLEYSALIAVPTTTSVKQTNDILSDYRGQLIYGQQGMGATQMQVIAVPFRGSRKLELLLEGAYVGSSPGMAIVRHVDDPARVSTVAIPVVSVR